MTSDLDWKATHAFPLLRTILTGTEQQLVTHAGSFTFDSRRATLCTYAQSSSFPRVAYRITFDVPLDGGPRVANIGSVIYVRAITLKAGVGGLWQRPSTDVRYIYGRSRSQVKRMLRIVPLPANVNLRRDTFQDGAECRSTFLSVGRSSSERILPLNIHSRERRGTFAMRVAWEAPRNLRAPKRWCPVDHDNDRATTRRGTHSRYNTTGRPDPSENHVSGQSTISHPRGIRVYANVE